MNFQIDKIYEVDENDPVYIKMKKIETLRRKSYQCLSRKDKDLVRNVYSNIGNDGIKKIILILISSITTYYGFFSIMLPAIYQYFGFTFTDKLLLSIVFGSLYVLLVCWFIHKGDFGKTQFLIFTIIYSGFSVFGIITLISISIPVSAYQILNTFLYILVIQIFVLFLSMYITRTLVCRIR